MKERPNVIIMNLEYGNHGFLCLNHDGSTTIFLNSRDSHERRMRTYKHELDHDKKDDFEKFDVQEIEHEAHRKE